MSARQEIKVRKAYMSDLHDIWIISKRYLIDCQGISYENFKKLWIHRYLENPFKKPNGSIGFVIESQDGQVVGFKGEIPLRLQFHEESFPVSAISSWVVDPEYRNYSLLLFKEFLEKNKDCFIFATSSNMAASTVYRTIGEFDRNPEPEYEKRLMWWINPKKVLKHKMRQKNGFYKILTREPVLNIFSWMIKAKKAVFRSEITLEDKRINVERILRFDRDIDSFMEENKEKFGIFHYRNSQILNWRHMDIPVTKGKSYGFVYRDDKGHIEGYLVVRHVPPPEGFPGYYLVTDIMYDPGREKVLNGLISASYIFAKNNGGSLFEISGYSQTIMNYLLRFNPTIKMRPNCTYWYKAPNRELATICKNENWWSSGIDGDLNL